MSWVYLTLEQAIEIHEKTVDVSGGGSLGHLDTGKLDGVLQHIQNDEYYPTFDTKLTHLFFCACKFHCFVDGNKRIAITLCAQMLLLNGYLRSIQAFIRESENISYHVASGNISKELLGEWIKAVLCGIEDDEALKLKILNAIENA
ncbi:MAG: Fic family protein [Nitrospira sp.]|nr:Fic family protein [Nitrospira sp.]